MIGEKTDRFGLLIQKMRYHGFLGFAQVIGLDHQAQHFGLVIRRMIPRQAGRNEAKQENPRFEKSVLKIDVKETHF